VWYTYFFVTKTARPRIKIGRSRNPTQRFNSLQNQSSEELHILLILEGDREKEFHQRFASYRLKGEWFTFSDEIKKLLAEYTGGKAGYKLDSFPEWLTKQTERPDTVGRFAVLFLNNNLFPRTNRLYRLLQFCGDNHELRHAVKTAHSHWRRA
jgi:hypothetical protein